MHRARLLAPPPARLCLTYPGQRVDLQFRRRAIRERACNPLLTLCRGPTPSPRKALTPCFLSRASCWRGYSLGARTERSLTSLARWAIHFTESSCAAPVHMGDSRNRATVIGGPDSRHRHTLLCGHCFRIRARRDGRRTSLLGIPCDAAGRAIHQFSEEYLNHGRRSGDLRYRRWSFLRGWYVWQ
jgi:hypothetical protein